MPNLDEGKLDCLAIWLTLYFLQRNESLCYEISELGAKVKQILTTSSVKIQQQARAYELKIKVMNTKMIAQQKQTKNDKEVSFRVVFSAYLSFAYFRFLIAWRPK